MSTGGAGLRAIVVGIGRGRLGGAVGLALLLVGMAVAQAQAAPRDATAVFRTSGGQFEIIGPDAQASAAVAELAERAWQHLRGPLDLPAQFSSAVVVRLVPAASWREPAIFRSEVEPGGLVSVRVAWRDDLPASVMRRALVQGLLLRLAVAQHGVGRSLQVPLWLEQGCVGWWVTRRNPAMLDSWQQEADGAAAVRLQDLLGWQRGDVEPRAWELAALWWFSGLVEDARATPGPWRNFLHAVLGGMESGAALARAYPNVGVDAATREQWWQVVARHEATARSMPWWTPTMSRERLGESLRVVLAAGEGGPDRWLGSEALWAGRTNRAVQAAVRNRLERLGTGLPWVHPFYRNAAISAGLFWEALRDGDRAAMEAAEASLIDDIALGRELEATTAAALDAINALGN